MMMMMMIIDCGANRKAHDQSAYETLLRAHANVYPTGNSSYLKLIIIQCNLI